MQAMMETTFDAVYLTTVLAVGIVMLRNAGETRSSCLFGLMAVVLGLGDASTWFPGRWRCAPPALLITPPALGLESGSPLSP